MMINKILFVTAKYCGDVTYVPTSFESTLVGAVKSTGLVHQTKQFHFDILCQRLGHRRMSKLLLEQCAEFKPDLVIFAQLSSELVDPPRDVKMKLIVPCAGKSSGFPNMRPKWMLTHPEGETTA